MTTQKKHGDSFRLPLDKELVRTHEIDAFFTQASALYDHLVSAELPSYRILALHEINDYESPLHMPEAINRFREVGVPIHKVEVALDIIEESAQWSIIVELETIDGSFKKSFIINDLDGTGHYTVSDTEGNSSAVTGDELNRILVDLSISRHERQQNLVDNRPLQLDVVSPVSARLIHQCLQNRPGVKSSVSTYYDISQHITIPQGIEFVTEKSDLIDSFRIKIDETSEDGHVGHVASYGVELVVRRDERTGKRSYAITGEGSRYIDVGNGSLEEDEAPSEDAISPYAIMQHTSLS